jgi:biopolymer transport protein ExbB
MILATGAMGSALSLWTACGAVALPLLIMSLAVCTVGFERCGFWWRWWRQGRRPWQDARSQLADCEDQQQRQLILERQRRLMAWGEPVLQAALILAPLLGLVGTTAGLMRVLRSLGPQLLLPPANPLAGYADVLLPTLIGLQLALLATALLLLNQGLSQWQLERLQRSSETG